VITEKIFLKPATMGSSVLKAHIDSRLCIGSIYSGNTDHRIHAQGFRWVAHETHTLHWFRYMVSYVQFEADVSFVRMLGYRGVDVSYALEWK